MKIILFATIVLAFSNCFSSKVCVLREAQPTAMHCLDWGKYGYPCSGVDMTGAFWIRQCNEPVCFHSVSCRACIEWTEDYRLDRQTVDTLKSKEYLDSIGACYNK